MADESRETPLTGGNMSDVTRDGGEVRRPAGAWTPNVHALLARLRAAGISEVPRPLGITADGHERLSFLDGEVAHYPLPPWLWEDDVLLSAARLLRRIHDASTEMAAMTTGWRIPPREPAEVVCHNDFAPYNLVFDGSTLVGVMDFDLAAPGPRLWDLAYLAYRIVPYVEDAEAPVSVRQAEADRVSALLTAYGSDATPEQLWAMMAARLDALALHSRTESARRPELAAHAAMYDRDAERLRARANPS